MASRRRWKAEVVVLDSSDEEEEEGKQEEEEVPKRRRQAAPSGRRQLTLQLSQQPASQPAEQPSSQAEAALTLVLIPKSRVATLMAPSNATAADATTATSAAELWVGKHAPCSEGELVVHKKKVQEVQQWLEWQRESLSQRGVGRVAVVTGPPGCGKSTVVQVLAAAVGFQLCEWQPPTPTLWHEYQHQAGSGGKYLSKLDAFEEFSLRAKLPALSLSKANPGADSATAAPALPPEQQQQARPSQASSPQQPAVVEGQGCAAGAAVGQLPKLVIVDDLPHAANPDQRQRLVAALGDLARTTRFPLVLMVTETTGKVQQERGLSAAAGTFQGLHKDLIAALEAAQATTFSFNPITTANTCKALRTILEKEKATVAPEQLQAIAEQAQGDLHNAISTLQFVRTGVKASAPPPAPARKGRGTKRKAVPAVANGKAQLPQQEQGTAFASRDSTLSMFHALGKLLYNKRVAGEQQEPGSPKEEESERKRKGGPRKAAAPPAEPPVKGERGSSLPLAEWYRRPPMEFDPEAVLAQSGLEAASVAAYLHENIHNFVEDSAIQDMAGCMAYLSQADCIASSFRYGGGGVTLLEDELPSSTLADAVAASTAARGVCFSNAHPAARRWLPLSAPSMFLAEKAVRQNREQLQQGVAGAWAAHGSAGHLQSSRSLACELLPFVRTIHAYSRDPRLLDLQPAHWRRVWNGQLHDSTAGAAAWHGGGEAGEMSAAGLDAEAQGEQDAIEDSADDEDW